MFDRLVLVSIYLGAASTLAHTILTIIVLSE
jgi:hypothetical protein